MKVNGVNVRGFLRESFADSLERWLPAAATTAPEPLPRYPDHVARSGVAGHNGGSGSESDEVIPVERDYPSSAWLVD
jgi:hypothetical protein